MVPSARKDNSTDHDADDVAVRKNEKQFFYVSTEDEAAKKVASYHVEGSITSSFEAASGDQLVDSLQTAYFPNEVCLLNLSCELNSTMFFFCYTFFIS